MKVSFILVEPAVPENVGAAARAIKTMGFTNLRLVNPCDHLELKAKMLAHGSNDILENAQVFDNLADAIADLDFTVATSAKLRWVKLEPIDSTNLYSFLKEREHLITSVGIVLGREESGLTNEEIAMCSRTSSVPLAAPYPSINLAQSAMVYAYSLSKFGITPNTDSDTPPQLTENINQQSLKALMGKASEVLTLSGISPELLIYGRIMERLNDLSPTDINLLHSFCSKFLEKYK